MYPRAYLVPSFVLASMHHSLIIIMRGCPIDNRLDLFRILFIIIVSRYIGLSLSLFTDKFAIFCVIVSLTMRDLVSHFVHLFIYLSSFYPKPIRPLEFSGHYEFHLIFRHTETRRSGLGFI